MNEWWTLLRYILEAEQSRGVGGRDGRRRNDSRAEEITINAEFYVAVTCNGCERVITLGISVLDWRGL